MKLPNKRDIIIGVGFITVLWIIVGIMLIEQSNPSYASLHSKPTADTERIVTSKDVKEFDK